MIAHMVGVLMIAAAVIQGPDTEDPYWLSLVSSELKMNADGRRVITSWGQKNLARLGDRVSVSILKILGPSELTNPDRVKGCLLLIREAFAQPQFISLEIDKDPKVTRFLLNYWRQNVADPTAQQDIRETLEIVTEKTAISK